MHIDIVMEHLEIVLIRMNARTLDFIIPKVCTY
ncbi:unnamed protein product, partial [marine sediment metagenome]